MSEEIEQDCLDTQVENTMPDAPARKEFQPIDLNSQLTKKTPRTIGSLSRSSRKVDADVFLPVKREHKLPDVVDEVDRHQDKVDLQLDDITYRKVKEGIVIGESVTSNVKEGNEINVGDDREIKKDSLIPDTKPLIKEEIETEGVISVSKEEEFIASIDPSSSKIEVGINNIRTEEVKEEENIASTTPDKKNEEELDAVKYSESKSETGIASTVPDKKDEIFVTEAGKDKVFATHDFDEKSESNGFVYGTPDTQTTNDAIAPAIEDDSIRNIKSEVDIASTKEEEVKPSYIANDVLGSIEEQSTLAIQRSQGEELRSLPYTTLDEIDKSVSDDRPILDVKKEHDNYPVVVAEGEFTDKSSKEDEVDLVSAINVNQSENEDSNFDFDKINTESNSNLSDEPTKKPYVNYNGANFAVQKSDNFEYIIAEKEAAKKTAIPSVDVVDEHNVVKSNENFDYDNVISPETFPLDSEVVREAGKQEKKDTADPVQVFNVAPLLTEEDSRLQLNTNLDYDEINTETDLINGEEFSPKTNETSYDEIDTTKVDADVRTNQNKNEIIDRVSLYNDKQDSNDISLTETMDIQQHSNFDYDIINSEIELDSSSRYSIGNEDLLNKSAVSTTTSTPINTTDIQTPQFSNFDYDGINIEIIDNTKEYTLGDIDNFDKNDAKEGYSPIDVTESQTPRFDNFDYDGIRTNSTNEVVIRTSGFNIKGEADIKTRSGGYEANIIKNIGSEIFHFGTQFLGGVAERNNLELLYSTGLDALGLIGSDVETTTLSFDRVSGNEVDIRDGFSNIARKIMTVGGVRYLYSRVQSSVLGDDVEEEWEVVQTIKGLMGDTSDKATDFLGGVWDGVSKFFIGEDVFSENRLYSAMAGHIGAGPYKMRNKISDTPAAMFKDMGAYRNSLNEYIASLIKKDSPPSPIPSREDWNQKHAYDTNPEAQKFYTSEELKQQYDDILAGYNEESKSWKDSLNEETAATKLVLRQLSGIGEYNAVLGDEEPGKDKINLFNIMDSRNEFREYNLTTKFSTEDDFNAESNWLKLDGTGKSNYGFKNWIGHYDDVSSSSEQIMPLGWIPNFRYLLVTTYKNGISDIINSFSNVYKNETGNEYNVLESIGNIKYGEFDFNNAIGYNDESDPHKKEVLSASIGGMSLYRDKFQETLEQPYSFSETYGEEGFGPQFKLFTNDTTNTIDNYMQTNEPISISPFGIDTSIFDLNLKTATIEDYNEKIDKYVQEKYYNKKIPVAIDYVDSGQSPEGVFGDKGLRNIASTTTTGVGGTNSVTTEEYREAVLNTKYTNYGGKYKPILNQYTTSSTTPKDLKKNDLGGIVYEHLTEMGYLAISNATNDEYTNPTLFRVPFQFDLEISGETRTANWNSINAFGRSAEFLVWGNTGSRNISLKTTYMVLDGPVYDRDGHLIAMDSEGAVGKGEGMLANIDMSYPWAKGWTEERVLKIINLYRSLILPVDSNKGFGPPVIAIVKGLFERTITKDQQSLDWILSRWVATDYSIEPKPEFGYTQRNTPRAFDVSMNMKEVLRSWGDYQDIKMFVKQQDYIVGKQIAEDGDSDESSKPWIHHLSEKVPESALDTIDKGNPEPITTRG